MKGVIIGTDLLQNDNGDVKVLEINSNVGIYQDSNEYFDFDGFVTLLLDNSINELHFIFDANGVNIQNTPAYGPAESAIQPQLTFLSRLKTKCEENNITFFEYELTTNSITVPFIEDASNKFILRQAYDSTALIDSEYCSDKFKFQDLISGSGIDIETYANSNDVQVTDTLTNIEIGNNPNLLVKYRFPGYDTKKYPELYNAPNVGVLTDLKTTLEENYLLQKYVYSSNNIVENKHTVIRSMDIFYGPNLDVFHLGSVTISSLVKSNVWEDEIEDVSTGLLSNKTRVKYINGNVTDLKLLTYHVDQETNIVDSNGNLISIGDINVGTSLKSITINGLDGNPPSEFFSTVENLETNINFIDTTVVEMKSQLYNGLFIKITLEDGTVWSDLSSTNLYIELSGTTDTVFRRVNMLRVGDKILSVNKVTNEVTSIAISDLEVTYETKTIYEIDVEESDLFLTSIGDDNSILKLAIQHNPCYGCGWASCGAYSCTNDCLECSGSSCFAEGTEIRTPNGSKKIEDFRENDYVKSFDIENNEFINKKSYKLSSFDYDGPLLIINGIKTKATIGHPFAVKDKYGNLKWAAYDKEMDSTFFNDGVVVFNLLEDEYSINLNGEWVKIDNIELEPYNGKVYNISVEDTHNYIANNILVHNVDKKFAP